ncbi:hypothetical protein EGH21_04745 [Halomicroarcula sp. F13]|uniref:DUF2975 domain-containing protein n=1 Tax=Haloarcula rubra TaxID=2487747 RepID=A0AAW4PMN8_9EURY|nr:hypothetical protein [Halomicroarcula rubra]MBX0322337.1 hypothetical protein [Halomicroarcula rubra]
MDSDTAQDDHITEAILSGSTYERLRYERHSYFRQTVPRTLALQSAFLGLLAILLPMYGLFPESVAQFLPAADPEVASPKVLLLGVFGGLLEVLGAVLLVATAAYRVRRAPLTEAQAHAALDTEDFARYVGLGTGGLAILLTVCLFAIGLGGESAVASYVATAGANPYAPSGFDLSVGTVSLAGFVASVLVFYAGSYFAVRIALERIRQRGADV